MGFQVISSEESAEQAICRTVAEYLYRPTLANFEYVKKSLLRYQSVFIDGRPSLDWTEDTEVENIGLKG